VTRSTLRYKARQDKDIALTLELAKIKSKYPRFGIRRAHALLRADGQSINHKRVERLWQKSGFQVPQRPKKRKLRTGRAVPCQAEHPNHVWSYDFQEDSLLSGRKIRLLNVLDELGFYWGYPRVAFGHSGRFFNQPGRACRLEAVVQFARRTVLCAKRYAVMTSSTYNGPEFIAGEVQAWLKESGSTPHYPNKALYRSWLSVAERVPGELSRQGAGRAAKPRGLCFGSRSQGASGSASALVQ